MNLLIWLGFAVAAPCTRPASVATLSEHLDTAERSVSDLDIDGLQREIVRISTDILPCLSEPMPSAVAGRFHRMMAIQLFSREQTEAAEDSARAARFIDPDTPFAEDALPAEHPLRVAWATEDKRKLRKVPEPRAGLVAFDGRSGRKRPVGVPTVVQFVDESGATSLTSYLSPREPMPVYASVPRRRNALIGCSLGGAALGVGTTIGAVVSRSGLAQQARDPEASAKSLRGRQRLVNGLQTVGLVGFGVGIGCGFGAILDR